MPDRKFPICSLPVPACIGREALLARMTTSLTKATPDHLQVIGPRLAGKTVLLTELVRRIDGADRIYTAVFFWDLAHQTLEDDAHFIRLFGQQMARALKARHPDYANYLEAESPNSSAEIAEVLELLKEDGVKVLAVLDGFDKAVANGCLTRNLWDQLRELAIKPSLRLVTASRRRLSDLIRDPNTETSPFWNIFDPTHIRVGCFDDQDFEEVLNHAPNIRFTSGARTELRNATNGSPLLTLESLNTVFRTVSAGEVSNEVMLIACDSTFPTIRDRLSLQWADCPPTSQDLFRRVREQVSVPRGEVSFADTETLIERGFVQQSGNKLIRPNRLVAQFLDETPNEASSLSRLFSDSSAYQSNLRGVLEHRISHISGLDATLARYLKHGIDDLPDHPDVFLTHIRGIVDKAFDLIWRAEVPSKRIPSGWMDVWKRNGESVSAWETTFPQGGQRVRLLGLITGASQKSAPFAKHVTKGTHALMSAVYAFGDFGQHQEGVVVDLGTSYSALLLCIELAGALARELPKN